MKIKTIAIGTLIAGLAAAGAATAWKVNGQFMTGQAGIATPAIAKSYRPVGPVQLLGKNPQIVDIGWTAQGGQAASPDLCDRAKSDESFGEPSERLFVGQDGWIFRKDELVWSASAVDESAYGAIGDLGRRLAAKGATLIVVVPPPRIVTGSAHLASARMRGADPVVALQAYRAMLDNFRREGVFAPDMLAEADQNGVAWDRLADPAGSNWTAQGARMAAHAAARVIQADMRWRGVRYVPATYDRQGPSASVSPFLEKIAAVCGQPGGKHTVPTFRRTYISSRGSAEIVVAGSELSERDDLFNFTGFLSEAAGSPVYNLSADGTGAEQALSRYLAEAADRPLRAKFVVMEYAPGSLPKASDLASIGSGSNKECTNSAAKVIDFDWNRTKMFGEADLASLGGDRARVAISLEKNSLRNFKVIAEQFDGSITSSAVATRPGALVPKDVSIVVEKPNQIRAIYLQPKEMVAGKTAIRLCSASI